MKMSTKKVLKNIEGAINRICADIIEKKGGSGAERMDSLSKLINSYSRLLERGKMPHVDRSDEGDPEYYKNLLKTETKDRKPLIR